MLANKSPICVVESDTRQQCAARTQTPGTSRLMPATDLFVTLTAAAALLTCCLAAGWLTDRDRLLSATRRWRLPAAVAITATATGGSLYYSEIAGYLPCLLCWLQRAAMYPLPFLLLAMPRRPQLLRPAAISLAGGGLALAVVHYAIQWFPTSLGAAISCSSSAPCTAAYLWQHGFISIPFMAAIAFAATLALLAADHKDRT